MNYGAVMKLWTRQNQVAEALRAGSQLERIGFLENLIPEHNITDLTDLMKVSEKLPPCVDAPLPRSGGLDGGFYPPVSQERTRARRL